jgi:F-type H+-transporting ATPase subunit epsilon
MGFKCTIVTPEAQPFDQVVEQVILPAHDGQVGILTNRAPILLKIGTGHLRIDVSSSQGAHFFISGGVAQMKDNVLTILTNEAAEKGEIKAEQAQAELTAAEALPGEDAAAREHRDAAVRRAKARLDVARI